MMKNVSGAAARARQLRMISAGLPKPTAPQSVSQDAKSGKTLVCDVADLRLIAQRIEGHARYLVVRPREATDLDPQVALAIGTTDNLGAAVVAAESLLGELGLIAAEWRII